MKRCSSLVFSLALIAAAAAFAKTTTWTGGTSGRFSDAANWDNGAPASGDTAKFTKKVDLLAETFDIGADGLTVENSAEVGWNVHLTGAGLFSKWGDGQLTVRTNAFHTGGTRVTRGKFTLTNRYCKPQCFGSGDIELFRYNDYSPTVDFAEWTCGLTNSIKVFGAITAGGGNGSWGAIYVHNPATMGGSITCDDDTYLNISWGGITVNGPVTCPSDKTLKINCNCGNNGATLFAVTLNNAVDASIVKIGNRNLNLNGVCPNKANSLTVNVGTNLFGTAASWAGTNIVVSGSTAVLRVQRVTNIASPETVLKIEDKGKLYLDASAVVGEFWVDGVRQAVGAYDSADFPNRIVGGGSVIVGANVWKGRSSGSWNTADNWSKGTVPGAGDFAVFTNAATLVKEDVTIASGDLMIGTFENVNCSNSFVGVGSLTKLGSKELNVRRADSSHAGGTTLRNGTLTFNNRYTKFGFGTGPIRLYRHTASSPCIQMAEWDSGLTNDVIITGAITDGNGALYSTNPPKLSGTVSGDSDVLISGHWGGLTFNGPLSFPGHTVSFVCNCYDNKGSPFAVNCNNAVDGSIVKTGFSYLYLNGSSPNPESSLTINQSTNQIGTAGFWGGTNITVNGNTSVLRLTAKNNLSRDAAVRLANGGKVLVNDGVHAHVAALVLDGEPQPIGVYRAADKPQYIAGAGSVVVGQPGGIILIR